MTLTRDNYESYFLDYLEGKLEEDQIDRFLDFLEQNPDLKQELLLLEPVSIPEEKVVFSGKEFLYHSEEDAQTAFGLQALAYLEDDLEQDSRTAFESYLASHPELQKDYERYTKTRLVPDTGIVFPDKHSLYRKSGSVVWMNWLARAAAVVLLLWGISSVLQTGTTPVLQKTGQELAAISPKQAPPVKKTETGKKTPQTSAPVYRNTGKEPGPEKPKGLREQSRGFREEIRPSASEPADRDVTALALLSPLLAQLEVEPGPNQLAVSRSVNVEKINDPSKIMTLEEFLASKAKKVGNESLQSAQRFMRAGLGLASELSGERIGYTVKDGKISSLDFDSKLLAFSIPINKK